MRDLSSFAVATLVLAMPGSATAREVSLADECKRVHAVYPNLMLAAMLEGEVDCGEPGGEPVSCNAGESATAKAARERRLAIRRHQEAGYKVADEACRGWEQDRDDAARIDAARRAIEQARATDRWRPEQAAGGGKPVE